MASSKTSSRSCRDSQYLLVIARNSSFQYKGKAIDVRQVGQQLGVRYILEGSVRRAGDRVRISAQLVDATTGAHRWAEHYDRTLEDIFAVQDDVACTIVAILAAHVRIAETERMRAKPPSSWQAYDYYLKAVDTFNSFNSSFAVDHLYEARRLLQQSLGIDPSYARSYAVMANTYMAVWYNPVDADFLNPSALTQAHRFAHKGVEIDPNLPEAHASLGFASRAILADSQARQNYPNKRTESLQRGERAVSANSGRASSFVHDEAIRSLD